MKPPPDPRYRHRFPAEIIGHAVWLYHVFSLSLRDVELLLAERGVFVSYETALVHEGVASGVSRSGSLIRGPGRRSACRAPSFGWLPRLQEI